MIALLLGLLALGPALAAEPEADLVAERRRLQEELQQLAQRGVWRGADQTYRDLLALGLPPANHDHLLGAQAAHERGDPLLAAWRLDRMEPPAESNEDYDSGRRDRDGIRDRYGLVSLYVPEPAVPALLREDMPFAPQEREAVVRAREHLAEHRWYRGLLPAGVYTVEGTELRVEAGEDWQVVVIDAPEPSEAPAP